MPSNQKFITQLNMINKCAVLSVWMTSKQVILLLDSIVIKITFSIIIVCWNNLDNKKTQDVLFVWLTLRESLENLNQDPKMVVAIIMINNQMMPELIQKWEVNELFDGIDIPVISKYYLSKRN